MPRFKFNNMPVEVNMQFLVVDTVPSRNRLVENLRSSAIKHPDIGLISLEDQGVKAIQYLGNISPTLYPRVH